MHMSSAIVDSGLPCLPPTNRWLFACNAREGLPRIASSGIGQRNPVLSTVFVFVRDGGMCPDRRLLGRPRSTSPAMSRWCGSPVRISHSSASARTRN